MISSSPGKCSRSTADEERRLDFGVSWDWWRRLQPVGFGTWMDETPQAEQNAEKVVYFVILSEAKNLSSIYLHEKKERFFASLRMTKRRGALFPQPVKPVLLCAQFPTRGH